MNTPPLTHQEILTLPAGRQLDVLVAEKVMGMGWQGGNPILGYDGRWPWPPPFSTDIAAAELVIKKLTTGNGRHSDFHLVFDCGEPPDWRGSWVAYFPGPTDAQGETASLVICRASLLAGLEES